MRAGKGFTKIDKGYKRSQRSVRGFHLLRVRKGLDDNRLDHHQLRDLSTLSASYAAQRYETDHPTCLNIPEKVAGLLQGNRPLEFINSE
jgi:hypothetical protein